MCQLHLQVQGEVCGIIMSDDLKPKELRLLLIGKTGDGKSATANTVLDREEFESGLWFEPITQKCQFGEVERYGRKLVVVDTPGLCDTAFPPEVIKKELIRSVDYSSPGFHAIILVLAAGKYTEECVKVRDQFFDWFGKDVRKHSLILITSGDKVKNRETYLKRVPKALDEFMESCGRRLMFFNNRAWGPESENQIKELIQNVDQIVEANKGRYFSNSAFRLARARKWMSNSPVYQWVVGKKQATTASEQTSKNTDQQQTLEDVHRANLMSAGHGKANASSSKIIDRSDDLADERLTEGTKLREQIRKPEIKPEELRLLLIGKTGDGKSATANTILGREEFESDSCAESITKICRFGEVERYGRTLVVVDTPGLCDTAFPPEVIKKELIRSVGYASPGFHAIIFVLAVGRYTEDCVKVRDQFFDWFGEDVCEHSLILITRGDEVKNRETYLKRVPKALDEFMESCGRRVLFFNNRASGPDSENQIKELIQKVDHIVNENEGRYFSNIAFRLARAYERVANTRVYQWMVKKGQAIGNNELTKRKTDQLQGSDDADHANLMAVGHDEVLAASSEIINASDEVLDEIAVSVLEEQMPIDETDHHILTSHDTKPLAQRQHSPSTCDTNRLETKRLTKTSHDTEQLKDMTNDKFAQGPILRDLIKRPGMFEVFVRFFLKFFRSLNTKAVK